VLHDSRPWHHGPFYERRSHNLQSRSLFPLKNRHLSADDIGGLGGYYMGLLHYCLAEVEGDSKGHQPYPPPESRNHKSRPVFDRHILLPRCYQDRTNQPHLPPFQAHPGLWFLVGLGCLRLDSLNFVNRRSFRLYRGDDPWLSLLQAAILISPENGMTRWAKCGIERVTFRLGTPDLLTPTNPLKNLPTAASPWK
jgi:hypothetical protein